jgi:hypothetical protein
MVKVVCTLDMAIEMLSMSRETLLYRGDIYDVLDDFYHV